MTDWTAERAEQLRRSVAMLAPGSPALNREEALEVLAALVDALRTYEPNRRP